MSLFSEGWSLYVEGHYCLFSFLLRNSMEEKYQKSVPSVRTCGAWPAVPYHPSKQRMSRCDDDGDDDDDDDDDDPWCA